ncbi:uncharacterized protein EV420DRAFT_1484691 [Desarmillaria tabescens]|uniref:Uncharacterized protein n=1 Tax=Armillaria tabescens TaxID=1929756 RepID=A0AA39JM03_ARMTA|nr:uncharacterized protein EV420DRAFT_1484691 [Desarmillaria tabescens]KAK0444191.1 hypothetical protein EV420DRAFT_1484691 [Desarmillaria tabescens]
MMYLEVMMMLLLLLATTTLVAVFYWRKGMVEGTGECAGCQWERVELTVPAEERCPDPVPVTKAQSARSKERRRRGKDPFKGVKGKKMLEKLEVTRSVSSSSREEPDTPASPTTTLPPSSPSEPDVELCPESIPEEPIEFPTLNSTPTQLLEEARQREEQARESLERYEEMMRWEREGWRRREAEMQAQIHQLMYQMQAYAALVTPNIGAWYPLERGRRRRRDDADDDDDDVSELLVDAILKRPERIIRKRAAS